jgi:ornithine--oxo-acid transaminase
MAAIDVVLLEKLPERSLRLGKQLLDRLNSLKSPHTTVYATGRGLFCALHVDESHPSKRVTAERLGALLRERGVMAVSAGNRVRIAPPLVISEEELWKGVGLLEQALHNIIDWEQGS